MKSPQLLEALISSGNMKFGSSGAAARRAAESGFLFII